MDNKQLHKQRQNLSLLTCIVSAIALLGSFQSPAISSTPNSLLFREGILLSVEEPELPPLGEPDNFLPNSVEMRLVIKLSERRVHVYQGEERQKSFPIAVGKPGWETPVGSYEVMQMVANPYWEHPWTGEVFAPGPDNPLGSHWIGFWTDGKNYIGFHGTPNEDSVGQPASHGCVRMYNRDIVELFSIVEMGTPVVVEP